MHEWWELVCLRWYNRMHQMWRTPVFISKNGMAPNPSNTGISNLVLVDHRQIRSAYLMHIREHMCKGLSTETWLSMYEWKVKSKWADWYSDGWVNRCWGEVTCVMHQRGWWENVGGSFYLEFKQESRIWLYEGWWLTKDIDSLQVEGLHSFDRVRVMRQGWAWVPPFKQEVELGELWD